jgi:nucleotide-binding universal stress UspA family protein
MRTFQDWRATHGFSKSPDRVHRGLASTSFSDYSSWPAVDLPHRAQFADLICIPVPVGAKPDHTDDIIEAALFGSGRPVLMVPIRERYTPGSLLGTRVVVGWNGSGEAVHAISAALPFLEVSARVEVITIDEEAAGAADAYEMATYLAFHGIAATGSGIGRKNWSGGDVIDVAVDRAAGLLVIGARQHSGSRALGSATRHILAAKSLPVMMMA